MRTRDFLEWEHNSVHTALPLLTSAKLREGFQVWDTKLSSGVWPSWGWMSSTGLLLRPDCQWHTDPKRWFNAALVSNPIPVTHNFLLTSEQLGQPAGEKIYRCCWLELEGAWGPHLCNQPRMSEQAAECGCSPRCRQDMGGECLLCHGPSLILLSSSREHCSSSSYATQRSFISFGSIKSLSQSIWKKVWVIVLWPECTTHPAVWAENGSQIREEWKVEKLKEEVEVRGKKEMIFVSEKKI